jgi:glycosyltransferase involved in cell wall biosynthesis
MSPDDYSLSVFFPAYNDEGSIGSLIQSAAELLPCLAKNFEIVVVNDGSTDGTGRVLNQLAAQYPFLKVINHEANRGYGAALITGFSHCSKDLIFYTDGDGQYNVKELPRLLDAFRDGVDVVNGYKISRSDPKHRIYIGLIYGRMIRWLFRLKIRDVDCDFRLFRRSCMRQIRLTCDSGIICVEMIRKFQDQQCRIEEVPVHHYHRAYGRSQFFSLKHLSKTALQLLSAWWKLMALPHLSSAATQSALEVDVKADRDARITKSHLLDIYWR